MLQPFLCVALKGLLREGWGQPLHLHSKILSIADEPSSSLGSQVAENGDSSVMVIVLELVVKGTWSHNWATCAM